MEKTVAFKKNARNVFLHILTRCNFRCGHCYINPAEHGRQQLSAERAQRWLHALVRSEKESNLVLIGGEPSLHPDLARLIRSARRMGYASITVDTNGTFCRDILEKVTPQEVDYFSVGLDGSSPEINDRIRGKGGFKRAVAGIEAALNKGFRLSVIFTASRINISDLKNMPRLLKSLGIDRFFIQIVGIRGRSRQEGGKALQLSRKEWSSVVPGLANRMADLGIHVTYPKVFLKASEPFACAGLVADNYFIFPNGRVYRCPLCEDYALHALAFEKDKLVHRPPINERELFALSIPEGCVMNKLIQPGNLSYNKQGRPKYRIACCLLKEESTP
jgi:MoaA/NifB/PqqE/SkfB family radical SAM enzyme